MKKTLTILAILAVTIVTLGVGAVVYAQSGTPTAPTGAPPFGGMRGGPQGFGGSGPIQGLAGPLHDYMTSALADAFGLTPEELQALHDEGTTLMDYAASQGMSVEEFQTAMQDARSTALEQALADGVITQEQADWLSSHGPAQGPNFGSNCDGSGPHGPGPRGGNVPGRGGRWQNAQPPVQAQP